MKLFPHAFKVLVKMARLHMTTDLGPQDQRVARFVDEIGGTAVDETLQGQVIIDRRRQDDGGQTFAAQRAYALGALKTVTIRQGDVHQHQIRLGLGKLLQRFAAALRVDQRMAICFECQLDDLSLLLVVFDYKNFHDRLRYQKISLGPSRVGIAGDGLMTFLLYRTHIVLNESDILGMYSLKIKSIR